MTTENGEQEIFFLAEAAEAKEFWRSIYPVEDVSEEDFFTWVEPAFPNLEFCRGLTFSKFAGRYRDLREPVLTILAALSDHFSSLIHEYRGQADRVAAEFAAICGYGISRESVRTHGNPKAMRQRVVTARGKDVVCEWHAKIESTRNRIHFALLDGSEGSRILIGIFVDHLDT